VGIARTEEFRTMLQHVFDKSIKDDHLNVIFYTALSMLTEDDVDRLRTKICIVNGVDMDKATKRMGEN
jgi:hypothetical protein